MRPATQREIVAWDQLVAANPGGGQFLQTRAWGEFKRRWGWTPTYWVAQAGGRDVAILFLRRRVAGFGDLWYAPKGPGIARADELVEVLADREPLRRAFVVKVAPEVEESAVDPRAWYAAGLCKSPADVQMSRATIVVDLDRNEDALLASFKPKTRYNIRLAARRGVQSPPCP